MGRRPSYAAIRRAMWKRGERRCHYCDCALTRDGLHSSGITVDHKQPLSRGGLERWENYAACCLRCNGAKGSMTEAEFRLAMHAGTAFRPTQKESLKKAAFAKQMERARRMRLLIGLGPSPLDP